MATIKLEDVLMMTGEGMNKNEAQRDLIDKIKALNCPQLEMDYLAAESHPPQVSWYLIVKLKGRRLYYDVIYENGIAKFER